MALDFLRQLEKAGIICGLISNDSSVGIKNFLDLNKVQDKLQDLHILKQLRPGNLCLKIKFLKLKKK